MSAPDITARRQPVDGAALLDDLRAAFTRYVAFPSPGAADAVVLWTAATHALASWEHAPRLIARSPEKRCGKSRLMDVITETCHNPLVTVNASTPAIFRSIGEDDGPTLLVDEVDTLFGSRRVAEVNEDLRGLLNSGHQRGRTSLRCVGPQQIPTEFPTFAMAMLAGIGTMPDTIEDRGIVLRMRRRAPGEQVAAYRTRRDRPALLALRERLAEWVAGVLDQLADAEPAMPLEDRAADTWEPLMAIADAAGGHWPARARAAAVALVAEAESDDENSLTVALLSDVRDTFTDWTVSFMTSTDLVLALRKIEDSPWSSLDLTVHQLAKRLREFGIKPSRNAAGSARGYRLDHLLDAFARYLRQEPSGAVPTASDQQERSDGSDASDGCNRQMENNRQSESAGQTASRHLLTTSDGGRAPEGPSAPECPCGTPVPGYRARAGLTTCQRCQRSQTTAATAERPGTSRGGASACDPR